MTKPAAVLGDLIGLYGCAAAIAGIAKPFCNITIQQIQATGKSPKLKLKASEGRRALKCTAIILQRFFRPETAHEEIRLRCVESLSEFYDLLQDWTDHPSKNHQKECGRLARKHLLHYSELAQESLQTGRHEGLKLWRLYPKHHLFLHVAEDQLTETGNPRDQTQHKLDGSQLDSY